MCEKNENSSQASLALWAKSQFHLRKAPNQATISRLLSAKSKYTCLPPTVRTRFKAVRFPAEPRLELALQNWLCDKVANWVQVNGVILRHQAERLPVEANRHLPADQKLNLKFSKGWRDRFQKRHGLKFRRVHREGLSADSAALATALPEIRSQVSEYETKDVWNDDEFGFFYKQPPAWSLSQRQHSGFKKNKTRITFLGCCNSDGTEKYPLMIIRNSLRPRPFKGKYGHELRFDYYANKKAWMTRTLLFAWLQRFDRYISRTPGRKVILFVDNCSAHGSEEVLPELQHVDVRFLPPNTTSRLQPLDSGVIATFKAKFRGRLLFRVFENIDVGKESIYSIDILTAMR